MLLLISMIFGQAFSECLQSTYKLCMENTPNDFCYYSKENNKCYDSNSTNFGCLNTLNKNLCLLQEQQFLCINNHICSGYYQDQCRTLKESLLVRINCTQRAISKGACLRLENYLCTWNQNENKCQDFSESPIQTEQCSNQYHLNGLPVQVTALACSQITSKECVYDKNFVCSSKFDKNTTKCDDLGVSKLACLQITTPNQLCQYDKIDESCNDNCLYKCQSVVPSQCLDNLNENACLSIQNRNCQYDGVCKAITITNQSCDLVKVTQQVCQLIASAPCLYDQKNRKCSSPKISTITCEEIGLNKKGCQMSLNNCIYTNKCRKLEDQELNQILCSDTITKSACINIKTEFQFCQWRQDLAQCQQIQEIQQQSCDKLTMVNGNTCKQVQTSPCKYDQKQQQCIKASTEDVCETSYLNLQGCIQITKISTACQWIDNQCQRAVINSNKSCESLQLSNSVTCSQYFSLVQDIDSDTKFKCYVEDNSFKYSKLTCRFDPIIQGCRTLRIDEYSTLQCGDDSLGLNKYACSLINTPKQICRYSNSRCTQMRNDEQFKKTCSSLEFVNPRVCAFNIQDDQPCKFDINTCRCTSQMDYKKDDCLTLGMNNSACSQVVIAQCYFSSDYQCKQKDSDDIIYSLECTKSKPSKELCLAIRTTGQPCKWITMGSQCITISVDQNQNCAYYQQVNEQVCSQIKQKDPNLNYRGYCYYVSPNCQPWADKIKCNQSCCTDIQGINVHVCSRMTNDKNNKYCYFENFQCQEYLIPNQQSLERIQIKFKDYKCENFNYQMCGKINPDLKEDLNNLNLCYQSSSDDRCYNYSYILYGLIKDKSLFLDEKVRANKWICKMIDQDKMYVQYLYDPGRCVQFNYTIDCWTPDINKQACLELTQDSYCIWQNSTFECQQVQSYEDLDCNSLINKNACLMIDNCRYNKLAMKCEPIQEIDSSIDCKSLSGDYLYNSIACTKVSNGSSCSYDLKNRICKEQAESQMGCFILGQNRQSCLEKTQGSCQWDEKTLRCKDIAIQKDTECNSNLNRFACLKVSSQACSFNKQCKKITYNPFSTCSELVQQNSTMVNEIACTQIDLKGELCGFNSTTYTCFNQKLDNNKIQIENFTCTEFPMNIHLCLSYTRGSLCQFNTTLQKCQFLVFSGTIDNCEVPNLSRDVCLLSSATCRYDKVNSKCETVPIRNEPKYRCSEFKPNAQYLYSKQNCISIRDPFQYRFENLYPICNSNICDMEKYCLYNATIQGCQIINYGQSSYETNEMMQLICTSGKDKLSVCDSIYNYHICMELVDGTCKFDLNKEGCSDYTISDYDDYDCTQVNSNGCYLISKLGQQCFVQNVTFFPQSCNSAVQKYQLCQPYSLLVDHITKQVEDTIFTYYKYSCDFFDNFAGLIVNPNLCSAVTSGTCAYSDSTKSCKSFNYQLYSQCDYLGLSLQGCNRAYCDYDKKCKSYNQQVTTTFNCSSIFTYVTESGTSTDDSNSLTCASQGKKNCAYYYFNLVDTQYFNIPLCEQCYKTANETYVTSTDACQTTKNLYYPECGNLTSETYCSNTCTTKKNSSTTRLCNKTYYADYTLNCTCILDNYDTCMNQANTILTAANQDCTNAWFCTLIRFQCVPHNGTTNAINIIQNFQRVPYELCIGAVGSPLFFNSQEYKCVNLTVQRWECSSLNYDACVGYTGGYSELYCVWDKSCKTYYIAQDLKSITNCSSVNSNSCQYVGALCALDSNTRLCKSQAQVGSCKDKYITSDYTCQNLFTSDQCYFDIDKSLCQYISPSNTSQLFDCNQQGLNKAACYLNTKQYCTYDESCNQINDLSIQPCENINRKACLEHFMLSCIWDIQLKQCTQVKFSKTQTCDIFQEKVTSSFEVNQLTCQQIQSVSCMYQPQNKICVTPTQEYTCQSQAFNQKACVQNTKGFCRYRAALLDKDNDDLPIYQYCETLGNNNIDCSPNLNKYSCSSALINACIFINNTCQQFKLDYNNSLTQITQNYLSPFICQNTNLNQTALIFKNYICVKVTDKIYPCNTQYINMETCLGYTNEYCQYDVPDYQNYNDQQGRCYLYDEGLLFQQTCQENLNYKICSSVFNDACVFKNNRCVDFDPTVDTCQSLSQEGIYASIQSCVQTNDQYCQFDSVNKRCRIFQQLQTEYFDCKRSDININYCLASTKNCQFTHQSVSINKNGESINKYFCTFAVLDNYSCTDQISQSTCLQLKGCKFQDMRCQIPKQSDQLKCLKAYKIEGSQCALATDEKCSYDTNKQTCTNEINQYDDNIQYLNSIACQQNLIDSALIYKNQKCQQADKGFLYNCTEEVNLYLCKNIKTKDQLCIFNSSQQKCQNYNINPNKCLENKNINSPDICSQATDEPCKYKDNNCVKAENLESESTSQGLNTLACLQTNLQKTPQCAIMVIQAECHQVKEQEQCMRLLKPCYYSNLQCVSQITTNLQCDQISNKVNQYVCQNIDMNYKIGHQCQYNPIDFNCKSVIVNACENIYQKIPCLLVPDSTKLSCIWKETEKKCQTYLPIQNLDDCKSQQGNIGYCKRVVKLGYQCEFIDQQCQMAKFSQQNWNQNVNQEACLLQKQFSCYWEQDCKCLFNSTDINQFVLNSNCSNTLSFLTCTQIQKEGQFCQFQQGQCRSLNIAQANLLQYSLINSNICKLVTDQPAAYDPFRFVCYKVQYFNDCNILGLNKVACVSDLTDQPCMWQNNRCQQANQSNKLRILQQSSNIVNPSTCYLSKNPVYFESGACVQVNSQTPCTAIGLSEAGCYATTKNPCLWDVELNECVDYEPFESCLEVPKKVNQNVCKSVDIDSCYYNIQDNSCVKIEFNEACSKCPFKSCNFNDKKCVSPELPGLNMVACVQMDGYQFKTQCEPAYKSSSCSNYPFVNPLVCGYSSEDCVYDEIDKNCNRISYSEKCYQLGLSQVGCKLLGCDIINDQCQCKQLVAHRCQYALIEDCLNNNLCYWKDGCKLTPCGGIKYADSTSGQGQCLNQQNCYYRENTCVKAESCELIKFENLKYKGCYEIIINGRPCFANGYSNCKTLICGDLQQKECQTSPFSNFCSWGNTGCKDIQCQDISDSELCFSKKNCYPMLNNQCRQFKQCNDVNYYDGNEQRDLICQSISQQLDGNKYIPCGWDYDFNSCLTNPCSKLGIDTNACNGVHLNNQYVCVVSKQLICTVCEQFIEPCDCLEHSHCNWNDDILACQSIPCEKIYDITMCNRADCVLFEVTKNEYVCKTKCKYHQGQNYCQKFNCVWNVPLQLCEECNHTRCETSGYCKDNQCCQYKVNRCAPICEKLSQTFCLQAYDCEWNDYLEMCFWRERNQASQVTYSPNTDNQKINYGIMMMALLNFIY